ncbi:MAG: repressor LexA [Bradyrhizobium sp.]|nr:repressor LexA [Bradyrhizobium sp.]
MMSLTPQQSKCFTFIKEYLGENGRAPSYAEMASAIGLASKSGVYRMVCGLEERGVIRRLPYRERAIEVVSDDQTRSVTVSADLWAPLVRYAIAEKINLETAVNAFIRDGLESA